MKAAEKGGLLYALGWNMPHLTMRRMFIVVGAISIYLAGWATATNTHERQLIDQDKLVESFSRREQQLESKLIQRNKELIEARGVFAGD